MIFDRIKAVTNITIEDRLCILSTRRTKNYLCWSKYWPTPNIAYSWMEISEQLNITAADQVTLYPQNKLCYLQHHPHVDLFSDSKFASTIAWPLSSKQPSS